MLPAYLWGIKTVFCFGGIYPHASCQPTYEELKQDMGNFVAFQEACCQPTYEELKPEKTFIILDESSYMLPAYLWGIKTHLR